MSQLSFVLTILTFIYKLGFLQVILCLPTTVVSQ